jgi:hypothetical protein
LPQLRSLKLVSADRRFASVVRTVTLALATSVAMVACGRPEDPARIELRTRLKQQSPLSNDELARVRAEVSRTIQDKHVRIKEGAAVRDLDQDQTTVVLGMLTDPVGMYDEGLRQESGTTFRVLNAPGVSSNAEIEAARKLWIDVETFLPRRFEFVYAFLGNGDYSFDLIVE